MKVVAPFQFTDRELLMDPGAGSRRLPQARFAQPNERIVLEREPFDLAAEVQAAAAGCETKAMQYGLRIRSECPPLTAYGDRKRFGQILHLLLDLAVSLTRVDAEIVVSASPFAYGETVVTVRYQGTGRVFEDEDSLAFAQFLVEAHGGNLFVQGCSGAVGTEFCFNLPWGSLERPHAERNCARAAA